MKMKTLLLTAMTTLGITAASTAQNVPSYVPTDGLVGWWPFNGNANDESGNGNNGNAIGVTLTTDRFGLTNSAYFFNGTSLVGCHLLISVSFNNVFSILSIIQVLL
jgi:hypothetical protein